MKREHESRFAAEGFALRVRWLLVLAAVVLTFDQLLHPVNITVLALLIGGNVIGHMLLGDREDYTSTRMRILSALRLFDGVLVAGAVFAPALGPNIFLLAIPVVIAHALVERDQRWVGLLGGLMIAAYAAAWALEITSLFTSLGGVVAVCASVAFGVVIASLRNREEVLGARDRRLTSVLSCGSALSDNPELHQTMMHSLRTVIHETKAQCGYIMLVDDEQPDLLVPEVAYSREGEFDFPESLSVGFGLSGYVAKMGQPITVSTEDQDNQQFDGVTVGVRSAASVPLVSRGYGSSQAAREQVVGVLTLLDLKDRAGFSSEDLDLMRTLASLLAVAVSNQKMEERRRMTFLRTMESLATALEARDEYTRGHSMRVCEVSHLIGDRMGLGSEALEELRVGTVLHDIGKIGVPDAILNKRGRLLDDEFQIMKTHPVIGYEICRPLALSEGVLMIIRNHHEKLDGSGYPDGLKGGELPLSLRIVCVADAFDAMSSKRPYRGVMELHQVMSELSRGAGTQFDPVVVENLKELIQSGQLNELYAPYWSERTEDAEAA